MSFLDTVARAKTYLCEHGRVSFRALKLEFGIDDEQLEALIEELVDIQQLAAREGKAIAWVGPAAAEPDAERAISAPARETETPEAERRQLTVLFCDLVDSTRLAAGLDPEDWREVVRAYQQTSAAVVGRFDGHVAQYLGDGLLVYYGWPRAHEDDAERAVRAGREILTALETLNERLESEHGIRLAARVGIHTGPVVIGAMGGGAKSETLALGDTPNIAARLESFAEPNSVLISGATLRLVPGLFVTKDLGAPALKGIAEPIRVYAVLQATGVRSRLDVDPSRLTPLVGRDHEVGLLLERWEQVQAGEGQALLISGEAGLGKSRLLQAFRERLAELPHGWLECRCSPYRQGSAFHPLVELVAQGLGFKEGDAPEEKLTRLERGVELAGLSAPDVVPLIAPLLSLPLPDRYPPLQLSPELRRKKTMEALVAWTLGLAAQQPLVMLVEDLHWGDPSTVELLGWHLEQSPTARVLTLLSSRPDFEPPWPDRSHLTRLAIKRLSRRQATNLIDGMTRDAPLPDALVERIVAQADGVPLFVEEVTKMVLESGLVEERGGRDELPGALTELAIPTTLQDSLMARLDRLDAGKEVAQLGASLGREFFYLLLRSVSLQEESRLQAGLAQLVDAELLYQRGALPEADFTFKHAMIQETAYQSLLKSVRQQFHARIAHVLEEEFPARVEAEPEVIARHYDEAGLAEQAIAYYQRAGERAIARTANEEAIVQLRRAIELVETLPESRERQQRELGLQMAIGTSISAAKGRATPECESAYARARELASEMGQAPELPRVLVGLASSYFVKGDLAASAELAGQALEVAGRTGDAYDLGWAHLTVAGPLYFQGQFSAALQHFQQVIRRYDPSEHASLAHIIGTDLGVRAYSHAAWCHWVVGHPERALTTGREAVALAHRVEHPLSLVHALFYAAHGHVWRREGDLTRQRAEEAIAVAEQLGFPFYLGLAGVYRGWARTDAGEGEEGVQEMQQALAALAQIGSGIGAPTLLALLADACSRVGRHDDALGALAIGVARAEGQGQHYYDAELRRLRGEILLEQDANATEEAESLFREALAITQRQQAKSFELRTATSLARLWRRQGKRAEARDRLAPVHDEFTEGFDTQDLKDAKALLEELE